PTGWHLPSMPEWEQLVEYLGGEKVAADKMKEPGSLHWIIPANSYGFYPNASTNESGFTALPGGYRDGSGKFSTIGIEGYWWSSYHVTFRQINASMFTIRNYGVQYYSNEKIFGCSIRCLRD
ncbi:MAG: FISUMP domain-containing protein, partial [Chloroflexota bacterium]